MPGLLWTGIVAGVRWLWQHRLLRMIALALALSPEQRLALLISQLFDQAPALA